MEKKRVCVAGFGEEKVCWSRWRCFLPHDHGPAVSSLFLRERAVWRKRQLRNNEVSEVRRERRALFFFFSFFRSLPVSAFFQLVVSRVAQFLFRCFSSFGRFFFFFFYFQDKNKTNKQTTKQQKRGHSHLPQVICFCGLSLFYPEGSYEAERGVWSGKRKGKGGKRPPPFFFLVLASEMAEWCVALSSKKDRPFFFPHREAAFDAQMRRGAKTLTAELERRTRLCALFFWSSSSSFFIIIVKGGEILYQEVPQLHLLFPSSPAVLFRAVGPCVRFAAYVCFAFLPQSSFFFFSPPSPFSFLYTHIIIVIIFFFLQQRTERRNTSLNTHHRGKKKNRNSLFIVFCCQKEKEKKKVVKNFAADDESALFFFCKSV